MKDEGESQSLQPARNLQPELRYPAERILIRCPNWVGDAVMATPTLRCLRRNYPNARLTLLVRPYVAKVLEGGPWADRIVEWRSFTSCLKALRGEKFDLAVLLVHSFDSALLTRLLGIPRRVGYTRGDQKFLLSDPIPWPRRRLKKLRVPKVELYAGITDYLRCEGCGDMRQQLFYTAEQATVARDLLLRKGVAAEKPLIGIVPGAAFGASKRWLPERFAAVADSLCERLGAACVAIARPEEKEIVEAVAQRMKSPLVRFEDGEMDLGLLKPIVACSSLMVTTDTGPRHYAVAFNVPVVVLMGPTDPRNTDSVYDRTVIIQHEIPCAPCQKRACPTDHRCMELITVEQVLAACDELLRKFGGASGWGARLAAARGGD